MDARALSISELVPAFKNPKDTPTTLNQLQSLGLTS